MTTLAAKKYTAGTAKKVRASGEIPAVIYGRGKPTLSVAVDKNDFRRAFREAGRATLLEIELDGKKIPTLIHIIETHPVSGDPIHVDFQAINVNEEIHAVVPVKLVGVSDAVKLLGGTLTIQKNEVNIKTLPKNLIASVEVSLEKLKTFHDAITVADLPFSDKITVLDNPDAVIASVAAPRVGGDDAETSESEENPEEADEEKK